MSSSLSLPSAVFQKSPSSPMSPPPFLSFLVLMSLHCSYTVNDFRHSRFSVHGSFLFFGVFFFLAQVFLTMSAYRQLRKSTHISTSYRLQYLPCSHLSPTHMLIMYFCLSWHSTKTCSESWQSWLTPVQMAACHPSPQSAINRKALKITLSSPLLSLLSSWILNAKALKYHLMMEINYPVTHLEAFPRFIFNCCSFRWMNINHKLE